MSSKVFSGVFFLLTLIQPQAHAVKFKSDVIPLTAIATEDFTQTLTDLLSDQGSGNLVWSHSQDKPGWLTVDGPGNRMYGTPKLSDVGTSAFRLGVQDGDAGAFARIEIKVIVVPKWKENPIDLGIQNEDSEFRFDLKNKVTHPGGGQLTFSATNLEPWMSLSADGILSGTPRRPHVKKYSGITLTATTESGGSATAQAFGEVKKTIHCPKWVSNPVPLPDAFEDSLYSQDLSAKVLKFEPEPVTFDIVTAPQWLQLSSTGVLSGMPRKNEVGPVTLTARVSSTVDGFVCQESAKIEFKVIHVNHPPEWKSDPLDLPDAFTKVAYSQNLSGSATDPDGDTLTFQIVSGPAWASISSAGLFSGMPDKPDIGTNTWTVRVSDGSLNATTTVRVNVIKSNEPPFWLNKPTVLPNAKEDFDYNQSLISYVKDPDNDSLSFSLVDGPSWATVSSSGIISGKPEAAHLGLNKFRIKVTDNKSGSDISDVLIQVDHTNHPPQWTLNPIKFSVKEEQPMSVSIAGYAKDPDPGDKLTFSAISGPAWAQLSPTGTFTGTPQVEHEGENHFKVVVDDGNGGSAQADVIITVLHVNHPPFWTQNPILLPNAKEKTPYSASVSQFAKDPDPGDTLTFSKASGPAWVTVSSTGQITGTPNRPDVGINTMQVRVTDQANESAVATVKITVEKVNIPPRWTQDPLQLSDAFEDKTYQFDISPFAVDDDEDPLTFKKISGPDWLFVGQDGKLSGVPLKQHLGDFTAVFEVSDGQASTPVNARGRVLHTNHPPTIVIGAMEFTVKERETFEVSLNQPQYVSDPDGDPLTFTLVTASDWVTLASNGALTLKPLFKHIGDHTLQVRVSDGNLSTEGPMKIHVLRNPRPPRWLEDPIRLQTTVDMPFNASVADKARDEDGIPIAFSKKSGPEWLTVSPAGRLSGTPKQIGEDTFILTVKNDLLGADATLIVTIIAKPNTPPRWTQDPIRLADAFEDTTYNFDLAPFAVDDDGDALKFKKISGPDWLFVGEDGKIVGVPLKQHVGDYTAIFEVTDGKASATAGAFGKVFPRNHPPIITPNSLEFTVRERDTFQVALNQPQYIYDPDGDPMTFTLVDNVDWITLSPSGNLVIKPLFKHIGDWTFTVRVSDGKLQSEGPLLIHVLRNPRPPRWLEDPIRMQATLNKPFNSTVADKAKDEDGIPITFSKTAGPDWLTVEPNGKLSGIPPELGDHTFILTVRNDLLGADAALIITVSSGNHPPRWLKDPIPLGDAMVDQVFSFNLAPLAVDDDNDPLRFRKVSGPDWLFVAEDGRVTGTPQKIHLGEFTAVFEVSDGQASAQAGGFGRVKESGGTVTDKVQVDKAVPGAKAENLWVIDSSWHSRDLIRALERNIHYYFQDLDRAQIHHSGIYLSADAHKWDGLPIRGKNDSFLMLWSDSNVARDFEERTQITFVSSCYNSPIWSMFRFYQRVPGMPEIYHNRYMMPNIPMDVLMVTKQRDQYKRFAKNTPQKHYTPEDYAREFIAFHNNERKPYRVSAIAPHCPRLIDPWGEEAMAGPENAYKIIVEKTGGTYYPYKCEFDMADVLRDYARKVIFRAYAHAKNRIPLSKTPIDPSTMKVTIGGNLLTDEMWDYDTATNEVVIYWHLIDMGQVKPGDEIAIEYKYRRK